MAPSSATHGEPWPHLDPAVTWSLWLAAMVVATWCVARYAPRRPAALVGSAGVLVTSGLTFASITIALRLSPQDVWIVALIAGVAAALGRVPIALTATLLGVLPLLLAGAVSRTSDGLQYWVAALAIGIASVPALSIVAAMTGFAVLVRRAGGALRMRSAGTL